MLETDELDFHPKFVAPYYGGLMNLNFMRNEIISDAVGFLEEVRLLRKELNNDEIRQLLNSSWRPSKVGAWLIGLLGISELTLDLINYLENQPVYCEHVIMNLAILNSKEGNEAINKYLNQQIKIIQQELLAGKEYNAVEVFQRNSVDVGFDVVNYLDSINSTDHFKEIICSESWKSIIEECMKISRLDTRGNGLVKIILEAEKRTDEIAKAMIIIKTRR